MIYLIGSLRNPRIPEVAAILRNKGYDIYDDWYAAGPEADDCWQRYEEQRRHSFAEALQGWHSYHVFHADKKHLDEATAGILMMPAGKSGHLELGYIVGQGKPAFVLLDQEPERFDIMYRFTNGVFYDIDSLVEELYHSVKVG